MGCQSKLLIKRFYSQSTLKLVRHLKSHHKDIYNDMQHIRANNMCSTGNSIQSYFKNMDSSREKLYKFMVMTYQPMSLVENDYFRDWVDSMPENYGHMSRHGITENFKLLANIMRELIKSKIKNKYVALTGDKWSSIGHQGYLGLTCHYIDDNWIVQR